MVFVRLGCYSVILRKHFNVVMSLLYIPFIVFSHNFLQRSFGTVPTSEPEVVLSQEGSAGIILLNRPKALNALNLNMARMILPQLKEWESNRNVSLIVVKGVGEKAFCAGGDIRAVVEAGKQKHRLAQDFFRRFSNLLANVFAATCKIPYIALIDGITMGGGVGLSVHGSFRVATERTLFAMPETAIGLFPDVGGGYFLPRLQGKLGLYLALTGFRLKGKDVQHAGVATHFVESAQLPSLEKDLISLSSPSFQDVADLIDSYHSMVRLLPYSMMLRLALTVLFLRKMSPTSLKIAFRQLQDGTSRGISASLIMEYRMSQACMVSISFFQSFCAVLVDRDASPQWKPEKLEDVTPDIVDSHFEPLGDFELRL
uniref:3-hydroxyisobutyryl-CoA hydrolase n=1 Tax=Eptatretus burgeri TaxID=7764 RepID=A0A8C4QCR1_EPTBU